MMLGRFVARAGVRLRPLRKFSKFRTSAVVANAFAHSRVTPAQSSYSTRWLIAGGGIGAGAYSTQSTPVNEKSQPKIHLYGYQICPYCNVTKRVLQHLNIDYCWHEVNPLTKAEVSAFPAPEDGGRKTLPIAVIDGADVRDSTAILKRILVAEVTAGRINASEVAEAFGPDFLESPEGVKESKESAFGWAKQSLATRLYPNLSATLARSVEMFEYMSVVPDTQCDFQHDPAQSQEANTAPHGSLDETGTKYSSLQQLIVPRVSAFFMYLAAGRTKKKYGISDEVAALREVLAEGIPHGEVDTSVPVTLSDVCKHAILEVGVKNCEDVARIVDDAGCTPWYQKVQNSKHA